MMMGKIGYLLLIFIDLYGDGVINEMMCILVVFCKDLLELNLIFNIGIVVGGVIVVLDIDGVCVMVMGKSNIIFFGVVVWGDFWMLSEE